MEEQIDLVEILLWRDKNIWLKYFYGVTEILGSRTSMESDKLSRGGFMITILL